MRLVSTLIVRDEEEILSTHLDYHLAQGVDLVLAVDNGSCDATPAILQRYAAAGHVRVLPARDGGFRQGEWVTELARLAAAEHGADWILALDADEFWWPRAGTLRDVLAAVPDAYGVVHVARRDLAPVSDGPEPWWRRMTVRQVVPRTPTGTRGLPRVAFRAHPEIVVTDGNHTAFAPGLVLAPPLDLVDALHAPARSHAQFERKIARHGERLRATPGLKADVGEENLALDARRARGELGAVYAAMAVDDAARAAGLADGTLVEDRRLERFLDAGTRRRPDRPEARAEIAALFADAATWLEARLEGPRGQARVAAERLAAAERRVADLEAALAATDASLRRERREHLETAETLRVLRERRAQRVADAARRLVRR